LKSLSHLQNKIYFFGGGIKNNAMNYTCFVHEFFAILHTH
jgi:hypothetical protein